MAMAKVKTEKNALKATEQAERNVLAFKQTARRVQAAIAAGYTLTGVRLSDPKSGHADGLVVTLTDGEGKSAAAAVGKIVAARA
jgi:hypothetical protein